MSVILTALVMVAAPLTARDIKVSVMDGDLDEPLAGASLRLPDGTELQTDDDGTAGFSIPDETRGEIRVSYPGYEGARILIKQDGAVSFTVTLHISAETLENKELVVEASMPSSGRTQSGRSVSLDHEKLEYTAEIGLVEDVMTSVKLLPGVGYTGVFNALPSIRGGVPGDLKASLDGFYLDNPYHWGGGYSIFDPKTIETAQLHHGVFSARYSHTISGLLELTSRRLAVDHAELGINLSTSAAGFNVSHPLPDFSDTNAANRGAVMIIGKITYWEPFVYLAKQLSTVIKEIAPINVVAVAPYIRSLNLLSNYRFSEDMELDMNAYIGSDGIGLLYNNRSVQINLLSNSELKFTWDNLICFFTSNLLFTPKPDMIIKANLGVSYNSQLMESELSYEVMQGLTPIQTKNIQSYENTTFGLQGRLDFDWDLKNGFLFSAGIEELYRRWFETVDTNSRIDAQTESGEYESFLRVFPDVNNGGLFSGAYTQLEYKDPAGYFDVEAGLRVDHLFFMGRNFIIQSLPVLNPRLNFEYYPLRNYGYIDLLTLSAGAGLFSSMNNNIAYIDKSYGIKDFDLKQNRSAAGVMGVKLDFLGNWTFTLEFYYKYIFDRAYTINVANENTAVLRYNFDGEGRIYGFDLMLQKIDGRFIDGWISYSFNYAYYHDPKSLEAFNGATFEDRSNNWYFPSFHRFSNLNLILNFKPLQNFNIYTRFGFASGVPKPKLGEKIPYTIAQEDGTIVKKYKRVSTYSDSERTSFALPMDVKFSWFFFYPNKKVRTEVYLAVENALSLIYRPKGNTTLNPYTGEEEEGSSTANFELPIPMISFGFKWSY
ncbi:MAG: TonB-dependent receptor [Spirochaetaceae bacterium]|nr:TonB-dependent receptor [Spirochaetaceae bacterium]